MVHREVILKQGTTAVRGWQWCAKCTEDVLPVMKHVNYCLGFRRPVQGPLAGCRSPGGGSKLLAPEALSV